MITLEVLAIVFLILIAEIAILTFKIYQFIHKVDKFYNYYIRSRKDIALLKNGDTDMKIPPINGECPTKEDLDNF